MDLDADAPARQARGRRRGLGRASGGGGARGRARAPQQRRAGEARAGARVCAPFAQLRVRHVERRGEGRAVPRAAQRHVPRSVCVMHGAAAFHALSLEPFPCAGARGVSLTRGAAGGSRPWHFAGVAGRRWSPFSVKKKGRRRRPLSVQKKGGWVGGWVSALASHSAGCRSGGACWKARARRAHGAGGGGTQLRLPLERD